MTPCATLQLHDQSLLLLYFLSLFLFSFFKIWFSFGEVAGQRADARGQGDKSDWDA